VVIFFGILICGAFTVESTALLVLGTVVILQPNKCQSEINVLHQSEKKLRLIKISWILEQSTFNLEDVVLTRSNKQALQDKEYQNMIKTDNSRFQKLLGLLFHKKGYRTSP
jgi:hypothetical protein